VRTSGILPVPLRTAGAAREVRAPVEPIEAAGRGLRVRHRDVRSARCARTQRCSIARGDQALLNFWWERAFADPYIPDGQPETAVGPGLSFDLGNEFESVQRDEFFEFPDSDTGKELVW